MKYVSGRYTSKELADHIFEIEDMITAYFLRNDLAVTDLVMQKDFKNRVEDASMGLNTVLFDAANRPSVYSVYKPDEKAQMAWLSNGGTLFGYSDKIHPMFMVDGNVVEILIGKYPAGRVAGTNYAVSLRGLDPANTITLDAAMSACAAKGTGHHCMTNAEWAYLTLRAMREGFQPRGNDYYGVSYQDSTEKGVASYVYSSAPRQIGRTRAGSGPLSWNLDGTPFSPADMRGNVREWLTGRRINEGEIQVLADNNAANSANDQSLASVLWKAFLQDGSLVDPLTADTLKWDYVTVPPAGGTAAFRLNIAIENVAPDASAYGVNSFATLAAKADVTVPDILKHLLIMPCDSAPLGTQYMRNIGERFGSAGGYWLSASNAGLGSLYSYLERTNSINSIGFRPAFYRNLTI